MNEIDFSIIFNSRERDTLLFIMLDHIKNNTFDLSKIEVIVNFDDDDINSIKFAESLLNKFEFLSIKTSKREINVHTNINKLAFIAKGKYIWALGDDCFIITKNWDLIAKQKIEEYLKDKKDRVVLGAVDSTSVDKNIHTNLGWYCDAPILTKEGRDTLGYLIHPYFISLGADVATYSIYKGINRIIDLKEIVFDHVTHNTIEKVINPDKTAKEYRERQSQRQILDPFNYDYSSEINRIKKIING